MGKRILIRLKKKMSGQMLMQVGRVVYLNYGPNKGKTAVVVDIVDENRIMVSGPHSGVSRQVVPTKRLSLTRFLINTVMRNQHEEKLKANIEAYKLNRKWMQTGFAKKLAAQAQRARNSDFDRHKAMVLRRKVATAVRTIVKKNRK